MHAPFPRWRALGLGLIVLGDLLVGGATCCTLTARWKGDVLFMLAAMAVYSVLARRHGLNAARHHCHYHLAFMTYACAGVR